MKHYIFGVDVGGTTVKLGMFSGEGELLEKWEIPTRIQNGGQQILPDVAASVENAMARRGIDANQVKGIGLGVPGPVVGDGTVHSCVNLGWGTKKLDEEMKALMPGIAKIAAGNDASLAALGELWKGGGKGYRSTVMVTLGTGVGGGVVMDGKIVPGAHGCGGEVGHITVEPEELESCGCGKRGCLEQYASANGIVRLAKRMLEQSEEPSELRSMERFTSKEICDLARDGEPMAGKIVDRFGAYLGRAMSYMSCVVDPEVFIIGGGMSRAGRVVTDAIKKYYREYAFGVSKETDIVVAELGNDAGIYGCAKLIIG